jgi:hypothetical protein
MRANARACRFVPDERLQLCGDDDKPWASTIATNLISRRLLEIKTSHSPKSHRRHRLSAATQDRRAIGIAGRCFVRDVLNI